MQEPVQMSLRQLERLQHALGYKNIRPTQPLNDRRVISSTRSSELIKPVFSLLELSEQMTQAPSQAATQDDSASATRAESKKVPYCACYYTRTLPCPCAADMPTYVLPTIPELKNRTATGLELFRKLQEEQNAAQSEGQSECSSCPTLIKKDFLLPSYRPDNYKAPCDCAILIKSQWVAIQTPCACMPANPPDKDYVMPNYYPERKPEFDRNMKICGDRLNPCPVGLTTPIQTVPLRDYVKAKGIAWSDYVKSQLGSATEYTPPTAPATLAPTVVQSTPVVTAPSK